MDAREFNTEALYNKFLDLFDGQLSSNQIGNFDATFSSSSRPQPHFATGTFALHVGKSSTPEANPSNLLDGETSGHIHLPVSITSTTNLLDGQTDSFYNWDTTGVREIGRYYKRAAAGGDFEVASDDEVASNAPELLVQEFMEQQAAKNYNQHNGRRQQDWCYDCSPDDQDKCDYEVRNVVMQDGAILRYRWYKFRHQVSRLQV
jgi:hypothetical protein